MRTKTAVASLLLVALLGACGSSSESGSGGGGSPNDPGSSAPTNAPTDPTIEDGAQRVEPRAGMLDVRPQMFRRVKVLGPRTLRVFFYGGVPPCSVLDRVDVEYGTKTVGITLQVGRDEQDEDTACIEIAVSYYVDVELDEPLGGRKIVDGAA